MTRVLVYIAGLASPGISMPGDHLFLKQMLMVKKVQLCLLCFLSVIYYGMAQTPMSSPDTSRRRISVPVGTMTTVRQTPAHDPVMVKEKETYYLFTTGNGISVYSSKDMKTWRKEKPVYVQPPGWVKQVLPKYRGTSMWAPDISYHNGFYYLYYSVSVFGKNTSSIGLAVTKTLDTSSADYGWKDKGMVIRSVPGRDLFNAIDPNLAFDENGQPWLSFGSFWGGMKIFRLNQELTGPSSPEEWHTIAARQRSFGLHDSLAGNAAIEAPFIFKKGGYYYLFVSWDYCCRGDKSDYKVVVGRSARLIGPFIDKAGVEMQKGGGTIVVQGDNKEWYGAGHNSAYTFDGKDYMIYHGYDAKDRGRSKLIIKEISWQDGWPVISD